MTRNSHSSSCDENIEQPKERIGTRHIWAFMCFLGLCIACGTRVNLVVAIVAMVRKRNYTEANESITSDDFQPQCPENGISISNSSQLQVGEFFWDEKVQGLVLGSFYYGYACACFVGGIAVQRFGGLRVFGVGQATNSVLAMFSPLAARASPTCLIAVRIMQGLCQGGFLSSISAMMAVWVLPSKLSRYSSMIYSGIDFGLVVTLPLSGCLVKTPGLGGWPSTFYAMGGLGLMWSAAWFLLVSNSPQEHPRISKQELAILLPITQNKRYAKNKVPWRSIFTSVPVYGIFITNFGYHWLSFTLQDEMNTYISRIQNFNFFDNSILSAIPYTVMVVVGFFYSFLMDYFTIKGIMSNVNIRRMSSAISTVIPISALIGLGFAGCDGVLVVLLLCVSVGFCAPALCGYFCSFNEVAPRYSGTLIGISTAFATIPGFLSPLVTGALTYNNQSFEAWRTVFLISSAVYGVSSILYISTVTSDVQSWNFYGTDLEYPVIKESKNSMQIYGTINHEVTQNGSKSKETY